MATDPETEETAARTVTDTHVMLHDGDLLDLTIDDDGGGVIFTTDEHKFWSITDQVSATAVRTCGTSPSSFRRHGADFGAPSADAYARLANDFFNSRSQ